MSAEDNSRGSGAYSAFMVIVLMSLVVSVAITILIRLADFLGPQIGDIISFGDGGTPSLAAQSLITGIPADMSRNAPCALDARVVQSLGGSVVIEARQTQPDIRYRVHWAGVRTSEGQNDCGPSADLLLNQVDVVALIFAAGGKGVKAGSGMISSPSRVVTTGLP